MRIRIAIPDRLVTPQVIEAALEATTLANQEAIARGETPLLTDAIADGVKWKPEPFLDGEHFDLMHEVSRRGWGDCDDLAPGLAAELRATGRDPNARVRIKKTGTNRYHALVEAGDGQILDPSRWAGMGKKATRDGVGIVGAIAAPFAHSHAGALCVMPHKGGWRARADLPWHNAIGHIASHAGARSPEEALMRAIGGAIDCGGVADPAAIERMRYAGAIMLTDGASVCGEENAEVGNIFGSILKAAKGAAGFVANPAMALGLKTLTDKKLKPIRNMAASVIPGGAKLANMGDTVLHSLTHGKGAAPSAVPGAVRSGFGASIPVPVRTASPVPEGKAGPQPMTLYYHPAGSIGPVIMRF